MTNSTAPGIASPRPPVIGTGHEAAHPTGGAPYHQHSGTSSATSSPSIRLVGPIPLGPRCGRGGAILSGGGGAFACGVVGQGGRVRACCRFLRRETNEPRLFQRSLELGLGQLVLAAGGRWPVDRLEAMQLMEAVRVQAQVQSLLSLVALCRRALRKSVGCSQTGRGQQTARRGE